MRRSGPPAYGALVLLVRNAHVHAPADLGVVDVFVVGDRVAAIGTSLDVGRLAHDVVDLDGATVVPGLVDGHVHITGGGGEDGPASSVAPISADMLLGGGVTSVVGLLGTDDTVQTPDTVVQRARALHQAGMSAWVLVGGYHLPVATVTGSVRGDMVHIEVVVGVGEIAIGDHRGSQPTVAELARVGADVHVGGLLAGRPGTVHLHLGDDVRGLDLLEEVLDTSVPNRVWHPTHVNRLPELLEGSLRLLERGLTIDVTAFPVAANDPAVSAADAVARWIEDGAPGHLTVSSDSGGSIPVFDEAGRWQSQTVGLPTTLLDTIRDLASRGLPLTRILPPFTSSPAAQFGLPGRGSIAVGGSADLLVLDADLHLDRVLARGVWHGPSSEAP